MPLFDDWVTDRDVTSEKVHAFVDDPSLVGERFLGRYLVATTSGITGTRGIFVIDGHSISAADAFSIGMMMPWLSAADIVRIVAGGGRTAMVAATGGHFIGSAGLTRLHKSNPLRSKMLHGLSAHMPLSEMVAQLNRFRPVIVGGYASIISMLAGEQEAGRLHIHPVLVHPSSEGLTDREYDRIARAFHAKVRTAYVATECLPGLAAGCRYRWLHLTSDWCILEPVDADYQPVPAGVQSHTVLLSNLANRVQPVLRYDLGDSVLMRPDPCPCGNPMPAIRVQGRAADMLTFPTQRGEQVSIPPLAFGTLVDRTPGIELFQIVQTAPTTLRVRLRPAHDADPDGVWQAVEAQITSLLADRGLGQVTVERGNEPPEQAPGGKHRTVIPLS
jgi:phenylacetate-coenzyme A ligase PaaK-like adenylate-forming protein